MLSLHKSVGRRVGAKFEDDEAVLMCKRGTDAALTFDDAGSGRLALLFR
jgi:hypothetical protein